jgi:HlyD family secretion protein
MKVAEEKYARQGEVISQAQISLSSSSMSLKNYSPKIYAPISGVITGVIYQEGSVIPAQAVSSSTQTLSQNIASIVTSNIPVVEIGLTEIDIPKVKIGAKATLIFDAFPDKTFTGMVSSIDTSGSVSSGVTTYPITITLDTENTELYANMSATANILVESKDDVLYVPVGAVQTQNGESYIRKMINGEVQNVTVETGISSDSDIEIVSGLNEGDEVVTAVISAASTSGSSSSPFGIRTGGMGGGGFRRD